MKITVPEGEKAQIVNAVCKFIGFKTEGVIEAGAEFSFDDGKTTVTGLKNVITAITGKDKKTAVLLGGSAADKELVANALTLVEEYVCTDYKPRVLLMRVNETLVAQTFVGVPTSVTVADFALFFAVAPIITSVSPYNGFVHIVRWFSYMQEVYATVCQELGIAKIDFPFDSINIAIPAPHFQESKKAPKKEAKEAAKEAAPKAEEPKAEEEADISKLDIRVGRIVKAWNHPESDKLFCEEVDVGEAEPRQIGSGIRAFHTFEEMQGHRVCVLCNLKPRKLGGFPSNGMLLCASTEDHSAGSLIDPPEGAKIGERVFFPGYEGEAATPAQVQKKKYLESCLPHLKTNAEGVCCFKDVPFTTSAGVVTCNKFPNNHIS